MFWPDMANDWNAMGKPLNAGDSDVVEWIVVEAMFEDPPLVAAYLLAKTV